MGCERYSKRAQGEVSTSSKGGKGTGGNDPVLVHEHVLGKSGEKKTNSEYHTTFEQDCKLCQRSKDAWYAFEPCEPCAGVARLDAESKRAAMYVIGTCTGTKQGGEKKKGEGGEKLQSLEIHHGHFVHSHIHECIYIDETNCVVSSISLFFTENAISGLGPDRLLNVLEPSQLSQLAVRITTVAEDIYQDDTAREYARLALQLIHTATREKINQI